MFSRPYLQVLSGLIIFGRYLEELHLPHWHLQQLEMQGPEINNLKTENIWEISLTFENG